MDIIRREKFVKLTNYYSYSVISKKQVTYFNRLLVSALLQEVKDK